MSSVNHKIPMCNHIIGNIYLGNISAASSAKCLDGIDIIINLSNTRYIELPKKTYHHIDMPDSANFSLNHVIEQFDTIIEATPKDKNIFIHCYASISRSVSLVLYYLMKHKNMTLKESFDLLAKKRDHPCVPNFGFYLQLLHYELIIHGKNTLIPQNYNLFV
jgi:protein-tyrosine phosphatase